MDLEDPTTATLAVAAAFEAAGLAAAVYGGLALAAYGEARETKDADFAVVGLSPHDACEALRHAGLQPEPSFQGMRFGGNTITRFALFGSGNTRGFNVVDLVEPRSERYARTVLARALEGTLRDRAVRIVAPEDFVLLKILSTRDRDLEDAISVVRSLANQMDRASIDTEIERLAVEIPDHPVAARAAVVLPHLR